MAQEFVRLNLRIMTILGPFMLAVVLPLHFFFNKESRNHLDWLSCLDIGNVPRDTWLQKVGFGVDVWNMMWWYCWKVHGQSVQKAWSATRNFAIPTDIMFLFEAMPEPSTNLNSRHILQGTFVVVVVVACRCLAGAVHCICFIIVTIFCQAIWIPYAGVQCEMMESHISCKRTKDE